jgi:uncharacterized protein DUF6256
MAILPARLMALTFSPGVAAPLLAQGAAGAEPHGLWDVVRHDVIPVAAAYVVLVGLLVTYHRTTRAPGDGYRRPGAGHGRRSGRSATGATPGRGDLVRYLAGTAAGGYVFFLSIVVVFYFVLGGEDLGFIRQALVEGSLLAFALVLPAFFLLAWVEDGRSCRKH